MIIKRRWLLMLGLILSAGSTGASTLKIGLSSDAITMDPFFHNETITNSILSNIFEGLTYFDKDLNVYPLLADSWKRKRDNVWIFKLKKNVRFHNGNPFNADDVLFSFDRIKKWEKSGLKSKVNMIEEIKKIDDFTIKIITKGPYPTLLRKLAYFKILDMESSSGKTDEQLGRDPVGTGPYKFVSWEKGESVSLTQNSGYRGGRPFYSDVVFKSLPDNTARIAAILSGEVDIINGVPIADVDRIREQEDFNLFIKPGLRLIYLQMDQARDVTPYVKGKNPFMDKRVREAIYLGIDEDSIVKNVMRNFAKPAGQFHPEMVYGHDPAIERPPFNPKKAKRLLAEAGYPDGFEVVLDTPNNRYVNDAKIAEAVASSLARIGIRIRVNALPKAAFFPKTDRLDTSFFLIGWSSGDGDGSSFLDGITHTYDLKRGYGRYNRGRYSNPETDALIEKAGVTIIPEERLALLIAAQKKALVEDMSVIPLHFQVDIYASKRNINFKPRADNHVYAYDIR